MDAMESHNAFNISLITYNIKRLHIAALVVCNRNNPAALYPFVIRSADRIFEVTFEQAVA